MKILIVTAFFPPDNLIAAQRPFVWAREWSDMGHDVTVLTVPSGDDTPPKNAEEIAKYRVIYAAPFRAFSWLRRMYRKSKSVIAVGETGIKAPSIYRAIYSLIFAALKRAGLLSSVRMPDIFDLWTRPALAIIHGERFDVVVSTFGPPGAHKVANALKASGCAKRWVADYRDLWSENPSFTGFPVLRQYESCLERKILRNADLITTVSEPLALKLTKFSPRVSVYYNGYDIASRVSHVAKKSNLPDAIRIVYTGSIYWPHQDPTPLFEAVQQRVLNGRRNIFIEFYGPDFSAIDGLPDVFGIREFVRFSGMVPREMSLGLQRGADALLFLESTSTAGREGVLTGKIFEYIAAKCPVLAIGVEGDSIVGMMLNETSSGLAAGKKLIKVLDFLDDLEGQRLPKPLGLPLKFDRAHIARAMLAEIQNLHDVAKL